ncbi:hypothetical protein BKA70DRAFT_98322 [Coprinopsis sp. MPI-PUGE-AT-0042]|nr:hypothetical protein BKA70DRAFT_98322 [Coprinopsis sp. MPI-PUGE-AT-0042]
MNRRRCITLLPGMRGRVGVGVEEQEVEMPTRTRVGVEMTSGALIPAGWLLEGCWVVWGSRSSNNNSGIRNSKPSSSSSSKGEDGRQMKKTRWFSRLSIRPTKTGIWSCRTHRIHYQDQRLQLLHVPLKPTLRLHRPAQARRDIGNEEPLSISTPGVLANSRRTNTGAGSATDGKPTIRVRRSTFVPGWAVPPRVLLVDDDAVSRKLSSKFLQVFGCTTDIAVDGVGAVNKMNLEKYDLVLMDIVMPKLDGVSATSIIRKFDKGTPIISMTSNSKPNEIMTYYSSGMNDILPKPFTKQGLLDMLEKHLMHLKVIQQMQRNIPRGPGVPPLSDFNFEQALAMGGTMGLGGLGMGSNMGGMGMGIPLGLPGPGPSSSQQQQQQLMQLQQNQQQGMDQQGQGQQAFGFYGQEQNGEDAGLDNRINPLAGMGLSDEQFIMMAQMVNSGDGGGEGFMGGMSNYSSGGRNAAASGSGQQSQGSGQNPSQNQGRGGATMMYGVGINFGMSDSPPSGGGTKRGLEDGSDMDGPMGKKSRFEVIE